ncbi:unnamed protein product, partial [Oikopleura dioica]
MSDYRKLTQKFCIDIVFWLDDKEYSGDNVEQTEAIRLFISKYLDQLRRTHCLRTDLGRLVSSIGSLYVQEWFDLYKSAEATEIDLLPVLISVAHEITSEETRQKMVQVVSSKIEGSELSSQVPAKDIVMIISSLFGKQSPKLYLAANNDRLDTSVERSRRMSLSEQILNISGGANLLDSPNRRAPCSRCTDLEQKLLVKTQCVRIAESENEDLLNFREDAKQINADLQGKIEKLNRQLQKFADYELVQSENRFLLQENKRLEEATAKLSKVLTENEVLRLRISQYIDKLENKEASLPLQQSTNEEESIQLQFLRKDLQEKEEELKVIQQKHSESSRKLLKLESAEYLGKKKDDLIETLEETTKTLIFFNPLSLFVTEYAIKIQEAESAFFESALFNNVNNE